MKKYLSLIFLTLMLSGCSNNVDTNETEDTAFMCDPESKGLIPYEPITCFEYSDNRHSDYDSFYCYYGVTVVIKESDWLTKHDSLHVERIKIENDTNWWDAAVLYGKHRGDSQWEELCNKPMSCVIDSCYYLMMDILSVIEQEIESRQYYFDSADWMSNQEYYEALYNRRHVEFFISGVARMIAPGMAHVAGPLPSMEEFWTRTTFN